MTKTFPNVSTYLVLNFVNTRIVKNGKVTELLTNKQDLLDWFDTVIVENELYTYQLKAFKNYFETADGISDIIKFRELIYKQLDLFIHGEVLLTDLQNLITTTTEAFPFSLVAAKDDFVLMPTLVQQESFKSLILLDLANLITNKDIHKLSHCANPECVLLFVNSSGRRKWCSMQICGNRKKVKRFTEKRKELGE